MSSKSQNLVKLINRLKYFIIPHFMLYTVDVDNKDLNSFILSVMKEFSDRKICIRSAAADEDGTQSSGAGEYDSVLNIPSDDIEAIRTGFNHVIASYTRKGSNRSGDEVIVQEMLQNTVMSGVVFTHDLNTGAPYYVINYDDISGLTDTVTSGGGEYANRTLYIHRGAVQSLRSERFQHLMQAIQELEQMMGSQFLDVEFALGQDFTPYLLQVRTITTQPNWNRAVAKRVDMALKGIQDFVKSRLKPMAGVYGSTTVLGQMPDWNPAEMIGRAPRALAFSLYETLITNHAWRIARDRMGYAVPIGHPLMLSLAGQPYIDVRLSFHSYLPAKLSPEISAKLVDAWIKRLKMHPELHDKVEFEVAITTYSFDFDDKIKTLVGTALNLEEQEEFKERLRQQTKAIILGDNEGSVSWALEQIEKLVKVQADLGFSSKQNATVLFGMFDDCIRLGTIPFSVLARHGFIARTLLLSLHQRGILTMDEVIAIQSSVKTVAGDLVNDMRRLQLRELSHTAFMREYGHLRPGTYDILSRRYDQMINFGLNDSQIRPEQDYNLFVLTKQQKQKIDFLLQAEGFSELDANGLLNYVQMATAAREYGKFVFTRSVSEILEQIAYFGERHGLSRDEMSHVSINNLFDVITKSTEGGIEERLRNIAEDEAEKHALSAAIRLPQVLFDEAGVHVVPFQVSYPNFITHKKVTATCVYLNAEQAPLSLSNKIVLIENADPGFDWIFAQNISGLITKYGGANSHMAIRCAEFGIPAAIGCGEQRFEVFLNANQILLDCAAGLISPIH